MFYYKHTRSLVKNSEICSLKWADFRYRDHKILIKEAKGNKDRCLNTKIKDDSRSLQYTND